MTYTPCRVPMCAGLCSRKDKGYCDKHADKRGPWGNSLRQKRAGLRGRPWQRLRAKVLLRDNYVCQVCLKDDRLSPATEVDHIKNIAQGGNDDMANLQAICKPCHKRKTFFESQAIQV